MKNYILFDDETRGNLLPFTFTRPVAEIRCGILTLTEKWEKHLGASCSFKTEHYLSVKYPSKENIKNENVFINGSVFPDAKLVERILSLKAGNCLVKDNLLIAFNAGKNKTGNISLTAAAKRSEKKNYTFRINRISQLTDIFTQNGIAIQQDFELLTKGIKSEKLSPTNKVIGKNPVFLEKGAKSECSVFNTTTGPVYLGKDAEVMEGCLVRGPFSLGDHATLKMGAKIYGPTTIGPECKVGGEVNNSVFFAYSNKAHDGFVGNSVIGEWCNIGADTNTSNLKNNYGEVKQWSYSKNKPVNTGLQFCGLVMGDHSKCGINTMFNTGTVVGICCNIFGSGFPTTFIPDFSWSGAAGLEPYRLNKIFETEERVYKRRKMNFTKTEREIIKVVMGMKKNM